MYHFNWIAGFLIHQQVPSYRQDRTIEADLEKPLVNPTAGEKLPVQHARKRRKSVTAGGGQLQGNGCRDSRVGEGFVFFFGTLGMK